MSITTVDLQSLLAKIDTGQNVLPLKQDKQETTTNTGGDFSTLLADALQKLDNVQKEADQATVDLVKGQAPDIHNVMIALEKANLTFSLAVEVRNKILDAYHEMMRMQV